MDRNTARAADDASRVLRVLQNIASEAAAGANAPVGSSAVPVTHPPVSVAVSAAQISGTLWVAALISVMALTSSA